MNTYRFWIRRKFGDLIELLEVQARNSREAVDLLPNCVYWDFATSRKLH